MMSGSRGAWKRAHRTPRRALFTPYRVAGGPGREVMLSTRRTTSGAFVGTGEKFVIVDDFDEPADAHRVLPNAWVGTTTFTEKDALNVKDRRHASRDRQAWATYLNRPLCCAA